MSKKNKAHKKHRFKYAAPATQEAAVEAAPTVAPAAGQSKTSKPATATPVASAVAPGRDFSYVTRDIRRLSLMMFGLFVLLLAVWWAFGHTSLGETVYSWIKV